MHTVYNIYFSRSEYKVDVFILLGISLNTEKIRIARRKLHFAVSKLNE